MMVAAEVMLRSCAGSGCVGKARDLLEALFVVVGVSERPLFLGSDTERPLGEARLATDETACCCCSCCILPSNRFCSK